jgi:hypothetical protein
MAGNLNYINCLEVIATWRYVVHSRPASKITDAWARSICRKENRRTPLCNRASKNPSRSTLLLTHDATLSSQGPSILTHLMHRRDSHRRELTSSPQHSHLRGMHACFYVNYRASWVLALSGKEDLNRGAPRRLKREQRQMEPPLGVIGSRPRSQPPPCRIWSPR